MKAATKEGHQRAMIARVLVCVCVSECVCAETERLMPIQECQNHKSEAAVSLLSFELFKQDAFGRSWRSMKSVR